MKYNLFNVNSMAKMHWVSLVFWKFEYHRELESVLLVVRSNDFPFNLTYFNVNSIE